MEATTTQTLKKHIILVQVGNTLAFFKKNRKIK